LIFQEGKTMTRAVIFDMFETLITHYQSPLYFGTQMAEDAGIPEDEFQALWRPTEHDRTIGKLILEEVLEIILRENHCYSKTLLKKIVEKRIAAKEECFRHLHSEIIPMLSTLKKRGFLIGLISNCFSEEADVIRRSELFQYFDAFYLSYEQGIQKPDEEIFQKCMRGLSVKAEECIYIGDGGSEELETARKLGMKAVQAVWYLQEGTTQPTKRKHDFYQMEKPLEVLNYLDM
jgi:putative hydrolase of the HAD superfamily